MQYGVPSNVVFTWKDDRIEHPCVYQTDITESLMHKTHTFTYFVKSRRVILKQNAFAGT